ncbi:Leucine-rich repeat protein kinase family protein [Rhynchospora pubera]|uniref:Leucine-rich repeat protein kinase family protein n=1 Tax=Rhynchospora pubera TaxID=906938 RepID=A0AAV8EL46_9POAL|nr:Leucine-rich repeat protein kinase family protein [Rhynchospora pubera]
MKSALASLGFKQTRKDAERAFVSSPWHSVTKGDGTAPQLNSVRYFSFQELKQCTDNFSEINKIGAGLFGEVYKGYCTSGVVVAIKRASKKSILSGKDFQSEIEVLSRVHHKNIVSFLGFCFEQGKQLLVYEYISNGTLFNNLRGKGGIYLDWKQRLQIALDSARALAYLHELANPPIIHGHVKSGNILLDENHNAKVISFIFSKLVPEKEKKQGSSQAKRTVESVQSRVQYVAGTPGYVDPESLQTGLLSEKSDIYGFGVVMLELITARWPIKIGKDTNTYTFLVEEVKRAIDDDDQEYYGLRDIIDPKIVNQVTTVSLKKFVLLALECLAHSGSDRPSMNKLMKEIDIILQQAGSERTAKFDYSDDSESATNSRSILIP